MSPVALPLILPGVCEKASQMLMPLPSSCVCLFVCGLGGGRVHGRQCGTDTHESPTQQSSPQSGTDDVLMPHMSLGCPPTSLCCVQPPERSAARFNGSMLCRKGLPCRDLPPHNPTQPCSSTLLTW